MYNFSTILLCRKIKFETKLSKIAVDQSLTYHRISVLMVVDDTVLRNLLRSHREPVDRHSGLGAANFQMGSPNDFMPPCFPLSSLGPFVDD